MGGGGIIPTLVALAIVVAVVVVIALAIALALPVGMGMGVGVDVGKKGIERGGGRTEFEGDGDLGRTLGERVRVGGDVCLIGSLYEVISVSANRENTSSSSSPSPSSSSSSSPSFITIPLVAIVLFNNTR